MITPGQHRLEVQRVRIPADFWLIPMPLYPEGPKRHSPRDDRHSVAELFARYDAQWMDMISAMLTWPNPYLPVEVEDTLARDELDPYIGFGVLDAPPADVIADWLRNVGIPELEGAPHAVSTDHDSVGLFQVVPSSWPELAADAKSPWTMDSYAAAKGVDIAPLMDYFDECAPWFVKLWRRVRR